MITKNGMNYYSTNELCRIFKTYSAVLFCALNKGEGRKIERFTAWVETESGKRRKNNFYEDKVFNFLDLYFERQEIKHFKEPKEEKKALNNCAYYKGEALPFTVEQLRKMQQEHPLVKDPRCFILNWWPDTEPVIFRK